MYQNVYTNISRNKLRQKNLRNIVFLSFDVDNFLYLTLFICEIFLFFSVVKNIIIFILKIIIILYYTLYNIFISYTL